MEIETSIAKIITPFSWLPEVCRDMYFRGERYSYRQTGEVYVQQGGTIKTDTYFNAFSIRKWRKYTYMKDLMLRIQIKGAGRITVQNDFRAEHNISGHVLVKTEFMAEQESTVRIDLSRYIESDGLISFELNAFEDTVIYSAEYLCSAPVRDINIALCVCTYRRESYIETLFSEYEEYGRDNIKLFISDNGKTLTDPDIEGVYIFPNKNYGGAGGFGRCMLEANRHNRTARRPLTHLVLMDDDILFDFRVIDKLSAFLRIMRDEYANYFVCGAMCNLDQPFLQYERNSVYRGGNNFIQNGADFDLRAHHLCVINEVDEDKTHQAYCTAGWWFCCMNVRVIHQNNYPFPCFFRGDDLEYALRNASRVITLNGLCVWHEPFYKKFSNTAENYYLPRNSAIINTIYRPDAVKETIAYFRQCMRACLIQYDYDGATLLNRALKDYFQGPDLFIGQDAEKLNKELTNYNHKMLSFQEALDEYDLEGVIAQANENADKNKFVKFVRKVTLNGYLIPQFLYRDFKISGIGFRSRPYSYFRRRRVFNADTFSYRGYFTQIDKKKAVSLYLEYKKNIHYFRKHFRELQAEYTLRLPELETEAFWEEYLGV